MNPLVSSVRWEVIGDHAYMAVWNRGGKAGDLALYADDAPAVAERLIPGGETVQLGGLRPVFERRAR